METLNKVIAFEAKYRGGIQYILIIAIFLKVWL